jgi:hypothetical protein
MSARLWLTFIAALSVLSCQQPGADGDIFYADQTSASLLVQHAQQARIDAPVALKPQAEQKYLMLYDIYIKARSYAMLNKLFFWLSLLFGILVLLWPSLSIIFKRRLQNWEWVKSATVQTTVTALAALMFSFYSDYKDKQTYAESLMRYVTYTAEPSASVALKVTEELARIDRGYSFSSINAENNEQSQPPE